MQGNALWRRWTMGKFGADKEKLFSSPSVRDIWDPLSSQEHFTSSSDVSKKENGRGLEQRPIEDNSSTRYIPRGPRYITGKKQVLKQRNTFKLFLKRVAGQALNLRKGKGRKKAFVARRRVKKVSDRCFRIVWRNSCQKERAVESAQISFPLCQREEPYRLLPLRLTPFSPLTEMGN